MFGYARLTVITVDVTREDHPRATLDTDGLGNLWQDDDSHAKKATAARRPYHDFMSDRRCSKGRRKLIGSQ